jgi:hypothetical protein
MNTASGSGRYSIKNLWQEARTQLGPIRRHRSRLLPGFFGSDSLAGDLRLLVQLRMARLVGCPVCAGLFPLLALPASLSPGAVSCAFAGEPDHLTDEQYGAVLWAGEVLKLRGERPPEVPQAALVLSQAQRDHIAYMMRVELLVHATGLMFLPHHMIARVRGH